MSLEWLLSQIPDAPTARGRKLIAQGTYGDHLPIEERSELVLDGLASLLRENDRTDDRAHMLEGAAAGGALGLAAIPAAKSMDAFLSSVIGARSGYIDSQLSAGMKEALQAADAQSGGRATAAFGRELQQSLARRSGMNALPDSLARLSPRTPSVSRWTVAPAQELEAFRRGLGRQLGGGAQGATQLTSAAVQDALGGRAVRTLPSAARESLESRLQREFHRRDLMLGEAIGLDDAGAAVRKNVRPRSLPAQAVNSANRLSKRLMRTLSGPKGLAAGVLMAGAGIAGGAGLGKYLSDRHQEQVKERLQALDDVAIMKELLEGDRERANARAVAYAKPPRSPLRDLVPLPAPSKDGLLHRLLSSIEQTAEGSGL